MFTLRRALLLLLLLGAAGGSPPKLVVPNFPDFMLKTRSTYGHQSSSVQTIYMQGARTRTESEPVLLPQNASIQAPVTLITQCDRKQTIAFDPAHKTFTEWPILGWSDRPKRSAVHQPQPAGPEVSVATDSVDTGERRQVGPYLARHVKTTIRVEPAKSTNMPARVEERDGWYIDLPQLGCEDWGDQPQPKAAWLTTIPYERVHFTQTGSGKRGFPVEEISRTTMRGQTYETRTELIEASSDSLDKRLFDLPPGYVPALRGPLGTDYSQPDTLSNRVAAYWTYFRRRVAQALQSRSNCSTPCGATPHASL
ncbi:MAG TPA: hypothetical protein VNW47_02195 [Terriglobales bacterium]|nr:hypothetical protein [Terriglobales bacterium]